MSARVRDRLDRTRRAMAEHKVTTAVFGVSGAAIVTLGIFAGVSSPGTASASGSGAASSTSSAESLIGRPAPSFSLAALKNPAPGDPAGHVSLANYAGQPVIVNFFASWCGPCHTETPLLARYYKSEHGTVHLIGVDANDSRTAALAFTEKYGVSYPVGSDPAVTTASAYGVAGLPQTFFLNAQHKIVDRVYGVVTAASLAKGVKLMGG